MAHVYGLKLYLFVPLLLALNVGGPDVSEKLRRFAIFVCLIYVKAWLSCASAADAAHNDLEMLKSLVAYTKMDLEVAETVSKPFARHTWYRLAELVPMALVSDKVDASIKELIV